MFLLSENLNNILLDVGEKALEPIPLHIQDEMLDVLRNFAKMGVIGPACDRAGIRRRSHYEWLQKYPKYKAVFDELKERFIDGLELAAIERAKEGSDSLLRFLLQAYRKDIFGSQVDVNAKGPTSGITLTFSAGMLNEEEKKMITEGGPNAETQTP